jgi:hypothetical protein
MRFKDANRNGVDFMKDHIGSSILRDVQGELMDREIAESWKAIPDAKPAKRAGAKPSIKMIDRYGFGALSDVVAQSDLLEMRNTDDQLPRENTAQNLHDLHDALRAVTREPDIKSSYQYLAGKSMAREEDGDVWQVKVSRRRRQQQERMSREHHDSDDSDKELIDEHGNALPPEALRRTATAKELKRLKKAAAKRRSLGEEVFTDDELESHNLDPPENFTGARKNGKNKSGKAGSNVSSIDSTQSETWDIMYLDPEPGVSPPKSEGTASEGSWMITGGSLVARAPSGSWS